MSQLSRTVAAHLAMMLLSIRRWLEPRNERGSVTLDHLLWAIVIIGLVGLAAAGIKAFIEGKIGLLH